MIYKFHVGDYVKRTVVDGTSLKTLVGYVNFCQPVADGNACGHSFGFTWSDGAKDCGAYTEHELPLFFERIGKYDFSQFMNCGYAEKGELDKMSYTKPMMMPGSIHEGDFVETADGRVGYVKYICRCEKCKERGFYEPTVHFTDGEEDCITKYEAENGFKGYKRIGRWTNADEAQEAQQPKEIGKLPTRGWNVSFSDDGVVAKINELVGAVNELRKGMQK